MNCPESGNGIPFLNYVKSKRHSIAVQTRHTKGKVWHLVSISGSCARHLKHSPRQSSSGAWASFGDEICWFYWSEYMCNFLWIFSSMHFLCQFPWLWPVQFAMASFYTQRNCGTGGIQNASSTTWPSFSRNRRSEFFNATPVLYTKNSPMVVCSDMLHTLQLG